MSIFRRLRGSVGALLLVWYLPARSSYVAPQGITPQEYIAARHPKHVRLTLADHSRVELLRPSVSGDSVAGIRLLIKHGRYARGEPISLALTAVRWFEVRRANHWGTVGLVGGGVAVALMVAAAVWAAEF